MRDRTWIGVEGVPVRWIHGGAVPPAGSAPAAGLAQLPDQQDQAAADQQQPEVQVRSAVGEGTELELMMPTSAP